MNLLVSVALFVIAAAYAAVKLGGGSSYLAVLSFWSHDPAVIRPLVWGLNVLAAGVGFVTYNRAGIFSLSLSTPLLIGGMGGAAIGARLPISTATFGWLLAAALVAIALRMFWGGRRSVPPSRQRVVSWWVRVMIGLAVGIASGLVGIGGETSSGR